MHDYKVENIFDTKLPFSLDKDSKSDIFVDHMNKLSYHHRVNCAEYNSIVSGLRFTKDASTLEDVPYIPVRLFKLLNLISV